MPQDKQPKDLFTRFVQVGRVAYIAVGPDKGHLCVIVEIIDQTRVLVDGPLSGVIRKPITIRWLHLTDFVVRISRGMRQKGVKKAWVDEKIDEKWQNTKWCKKLEAKKRKAALTDFQRFQLMIAKKQRNFIVRKEILRLKKEAAKAK